MALWSRKENEEPEQDPNKDCLFEGVRDREEEDIATKAKMATYLNSVFNSSGYQWFIESLRKNLSLDWGSDGFTEASSCRLIRQSIMSRIPSGVISRHRPPDIHHATFRIQVTPGVFRHLVNGSVAHLMTLTSSSPKAVQALSVQDYLDRTWSSGGLELVEIMKTACGGDGAAIQTCMNLIFQNRELFNGIQADEEQIPLTKALKYQHIWKGCTMQTHPPCWSQFLALGTRSLIVASSWLGLVQRFKDPLPGKVSPPAPAASKDKMNMNGPFSILWIIPCQM